MIKNNPQISYLSNTLLAGIKCRRLYMPREYYQWHRKNYTRLNQDPIFSGSQYSNPQASKPEESDFQISNLPWLINFLFEPLGVDTTDWSMDFGTRGKFAFSHRFGSPTSINSEMRNIFAHVLEKKDHMKLNCEDLKKESLKTLLTHPLPQEIPLITRSTSLKQKCISCHSEKNAYINAAPWIAFENDQQLKKQLDLSQSSPMPLLEKIKYRMSHETSFAKKMPPNELSLRDKDVNAFIDQLEKLLD